MKLFHKTSFFLNEAPCPRFRKIYCKFLRKGWHISWWEWISVVIGRKAKTNAVLLFKKKGGQAGSSKWEGKKECWGVADGEEDDKGSCSWCVSTGISQHVMSHPLVHTLTRMHPWTHTFISILHPTQIPSHHPSTYSLRCDIRLRQRFFL